ncbi:Acetyl-/propionyl-coenzyme A carboxylase alpha chain [Frankia canadensis]|uniref:Biotin-dependent 3-methylcrotonyl-coenzyme A carboxylase alpha1 subunit n=1 Tax=Frankia canadensis TaxID=1836972 RepID=A0A2I2KPT5_9ACTN|nr:biotin carboxylase N-terminal domain-containing protein [Frankia canadensis]SNQ47683.1 Acetyl-/propionyl-coenzyme A carboxylase alpha chain [Frankia canadensis]SOU54973.1 Acetyl-/propionyl-coenzyme A carboxylase alpha chain [Frankia canadensis]
MTTIRKLLVANRGEIVSRVFRTARELDVATVAVYSDPDAEAPFVAEADEAVRLPGATPAETYLRADLVIDAARRTGADAVHPGYGFLSENAAFARQCRQAGIVFVGPPPEAVEAMGSKTTAKKIMAEAGVPVLPGLLVDAELRADDARLSAAATALGFPVLVKAVYGGGGRGMRIVTGPDELAGTVASACREAESAFGDGAVFLERYVERPRHVEVQIFADTQGEVVHLFERECSVQRRYQKIIEEAPSPAVDDGLRARLGAAAVTAARAVDYVGAGTVEFVLDQAGDFYFLEMNTRLQVEHPVTEMITGLDLVRAQIQVAEGAPLPAELRAAHIGGHAVEARLYAEDPAAGFLPSAGTLVRFDVPDLPGVRVDTGVRAGTPVQVYYDPMLAKVIAHGPTRELAVRRLAAALARSHVDGLATNRDLLVAILREEQFLAGEIDTGYLDRHDPAKLGAPPADEDRTVAHLAAVVLAEAETRRARRALLPTLPSGWRNVGSSPQLVTVEVAGTTLEIGYRHVHHRPPEADSAAHRAADGFDVWVDGRRARVALHRVAARADGSTTVDLTVAGVRCVLLVARDGPVAHVHGRGGTTVARILPRFVEPGAVVEPGSLVAPMPGTVVRVAVEVGERVSAGDAVLVLEAMKMEHTVTAPGPGVVRELAATVGSVVDGGRVLAVLEPDPEPTQRAPASTPGVTR